MADLYVGAPDPQKGPDNPSSDYKAMQDYWKMVECINGGAETMRAAGELYLPRMTNENVEDYRLRRRNAPFTNIYLDVSRNLASKPFGREAKLEEGAPQPFVDLCEDIDGQDNNFHVFASNTFQAGLDKGIDWILVDYTKAPLPGEGKIRSIAEEKAAGLRPYWVHIPAERLIAAYSDMINGRESFVHVRIREDIVERDGWGEEIAKCQVRVYDRIKLGPGNYAPATYQVFEKVVEPASKTSWVSIEGPSPVSIGVIALVPFMAGKRIGSSWKVRPPLRDIAYLQIEEYQQESNLKSITEQTCYPMLAGNGVSGTTPGQNGAPVRVPTGPRAVLFAPPDSNGKHGEWKVIEPSSESIKMLQTRLEATQKNIRDLGMAPLTQTNLTVITTANVAMKAQSQLQAWALALKDALEQAFVYTAMWLNIDAQEPEVDIYTDFGVELGDDTDITNVLKCHEDGLLSHQTTLEELKRRSFLSENLDIEKEKLRLAADQALAIANAVQAIDPITGQPVLPSSRPLLLSKPTAKPTKPRIN
jgi:hypothetical protein